MGMSPVGRSLWGSTGRPTGVPGFRFRFQLGDIPGAGASLPGKGRLQRALLELLLLEERLGLILSWSLSGSCHLERLLSQALH